MKAKKCLFPLKLRYVIRKFVAYSLYLYLFTLTYTQLFSQSTLQEKCQHCWSIEGHLQTGGILDFSFLFEPEVTEFSSVYSLHFAKKTNGRQLWQQLYNYPTIGVQFLHARFGNADIFGQAYSIVPTLNFTKQKKRFNLQYRIGLGLGYVTRPYHAIYNRINNVIGSKINASAVAQISLEWQLNPKLQLTTTAGVNHLSNANVQIPNFGINVLALGIGLRYHPNVPNYRLLKDSLPTPSKSIRPFVRLAYGLTELSEAGGAKFPIYTMGIFVGKRLNVKSRVYAGIEADYYTSIYHYVVNQVAFQENQKAKAWKIAPFIGYELFLGQLSVIGQAGIYVYNPFLEKRFTPTKLGFQWYFWPTYTRVGKELFVGVYVKGHRSKADHLAFGMGYVF